MSTSSHRLIGVIGILATIILVTSPGSHGARILCVSFLSTKSHKITYEPLLEALADRGHQVTVISTVPSKNTRKNMEEILTIDFDDYIASMPNMLERKEKNAGLNPFEMFPRITELCSLSLDLPQVKSVQGQKFDLVLVPANVNECAMAFGYTFNAPMILISPVEVMALVAGYFGNPSPPSFVPNLFTGYSEKMNFYERFLNFGMEVIFWALTDLYYFPLIQSAYREKLGSHLPSVADLYKSSSLIFSNSHFSISSIRPFLPDVVEVGGMHCHAPKPLPKDLENFVNGSGAHGFILFSLGSAVKTSQMSDEKRLRILNAFRQLKQNVLWKWETETMSDLPPNVKLSKWVPQQDVLGHPRIKAFITHGGFGSTTESIYHGVPIIGIPLFGDQNRNMETAQAKGFALMLDFNNFTSESFLSAIHQVLHNAKYKENVTRLSKIFKDQITHPLDRAIYWSEYIINHKGASHLRSTARSLNFFQYHSLDVITLIATVSIICIFITWKLLPIILSTICKLMCRIIWKKRDLPKSVKQNKKTK